MSRRLVPDAHDLGRRTEGRVVQEVGGQFRFLDHTGDLAMECFGRDFPELLVSGAKGMFYAIAEEELPGSPAERRAEVAGDSPSILFHSWLKELLFVYDTERFLPAEYEVQVADLSQARGRLKGQTVSDEVMLPGPIKAVTYHGLKVEKQADGVWRAYVVFDA
jgi:SHS2 domain-containing protein